MSTLRLLISDSYDPWFNLAVEECIFRQMPATQRVLFLWRNADTVVIGRAQNPWKECNTRRMEEDNVRLARRSSGGGAVFHDLGNTCFTFMAGKPEYDKTISTSIVLNALNSLGVTAEASGRNDLVVKTPDGDRKVSGSAYRETMDRGFHHGTLLLNADLSRLANYLNPDKKKLQAKGITSVRGRVANLVELLPGITHEQSCDRPFHTCWTNGLPGAAWNCTLTWRWAILPARRSLRIVSILHRWRRWPHVYRAVCTMQTVCNRRAKRCGWISRTTSGSYGISPNGSLARCVNKNK